MSMYGYDPSKFINDYSWIGDVGKTLSKTASAMPELVEYNKLLHTNNQFKQMNYEAMNHMINDMEDSNHVMAIARRFGIGTEESDIDSLKQQIISRIPKFKDTMQNGEYASQLVNNFVVPIAGLIQNGEMGAFDFLSKYMTGDMDKSWGETSLGQQQKEEKNFQRQLGQRQQMHEQDVRNRHGQDVDPSVGTAKLDADFNKGENVDKAKGVMAIVEKFESPSDAWNSEIFKDDGSEIGFDERLQAYNLLVNEQKRESDEQWRQFQKYKYDSSNKQESIAVIERFMNNVDKSIQDAIMAQSRISTTARGNVKTTLLEENKRHLAQLRERRDFYQTWLTEASTTVDHRTARRIAESTHSENRENKKRDLINRFTSDPKQWAGGLFTGPQGRWNNFRDFFVSEFGEEPPQPDKKTWTYNDQIKESSNNTGEMTPEVRTAIEKAKQFQMQAKNNPEFSNHPNFEKTKELLQKYNVQIP